MDSYKVNYSKSSEEQLYNRQTMNNPYGSLHKILDSEEMKKLFDKNIPKYVLFMEHIGHQFFLVERNEHMVCTFYHYTPGRGTLEASVDLDKLNSIILLLQHPHNILHLILSWTTSEIHLLITPKAKGINGVLSEGSKSNFLFPIDTNTNIIYKLDKRKASHFRGFDDEGKLTLQPSAIEVWRESLMAIEKLMEAKTNNDQQIEAVLVNSSLSLLVSGFEIYTKRRFLEIEGEGLTVKSDKLLLEFGSRRKQDLDVEYIKDDAKRKSLTVVNYLIKEKKINFQNYDECKKAYNKGYDIKFGDLGVSDKGLVEMKEFIKLRHKFIHLHPTAGMLRNKILKNEGMIASNKDLLERAIKAFNEFIYKLHDKTIKITQPPKRENKILY